MNVPVSRTGWNVLKTGGRKPGKPMARVFGTRMAPMKLQHGFMRPWTGAFPVYDIQSGQVSALIRPWALLPEGEGITRIPEG